MIIQFQFTKIDSPQTLTSLHVSHLTTHGRKINIQKDLVLHRIDSIHYYKYIGMNVIAKQLI